jgi:hypothetical protein
MPSMLCTTHLLHGFLGSSALAGQNSLAVLVELKLGNNDVGGVDANWDRGAVDLLAGDTVNVDDPLLTVDLNNLAFAALEAATNDHDLIVLADRHRASLVRAREAEEQEEEAELENEFNTVNQGFWQGWSTEKVRVHNSHNPDISHSLEMINLKLPCAPHGAPWTRKRS